MQSPPPPKKKEKQIPFEKHKHGMVVFFTGVMSYYVLYM